MQLFTKEARLLHVLASLIALAGFFVIFSSSLWGIGISPDSAEYVNSARQLLAGAGFFSLPSHWAPGYPLLLALMGLISTDLLEAIRLLQCFMFAAMLYTASILMAVINRSHSPAMVLGSVLFLVSYTTYNIYFYAWSEAPFMLCQLLSALMLMQYWQAGKQGYLILAAVLAALACLFRYAGVAWIGASALALLLVGAGNVLTRFRRAFVYGLIAVAPLALYLLLNMVVRDESTNRQFLVHLVTREELLTLVFLIYEWFGGGFGILVFAVTLILVGAVLFIGLRHAPGHTGTMTNFAWLAILHTLVYLAFIIFSRSFLDAYIPFDDRMFVPMYCFFFLLVTAVIARLVSEQDRLGMLLGTGAFFCLLVANTLVLLPIVKSNSELGQGYLSAYTKSISSLDQIAELKNKVLYSNAPDYIRLVSSMTPQNYPIKFSQVEQSVNMEYWADFDVMKQAVQAGQAYVVHYESFEWRQYYATHAELLDEGFVDLISGLGVKVMGFPLTADPVAEAEPVP